MIVSPKLLLAATGGATPVAFASPAHDKKVADKKGDVTDITGATDVEPRASRRRRARRTAQTRADCRSEVSPSRRLSG
jgi:hypothetical protein